ncbi:LysR family transcriptional regulator [Tatumella citrea]|nr:LysR family transcriptional regulator [Tatumella citrea]
MMDTNIQKYKAFLSVVEHGSFTRAAEKIFYSQSGISRMINDLESEWGISLFERSRSGVRLTAEGSHLLPFARSVYEEYQKLLAEVDAVNGLHSGTVRIGTFSSVAVHWLPDMLSRFRTRYPDIHFELVPGDYHEIEQWIAEGSVDCGFTRLPARQSLKTLFLKRDDYLVVMPEDHPLAEQDRVPLQALCDYPFLLLEKGSNNEISEIFRQHHLRPQVRYTLWDDYAVMAMVGKNLGISLLPRLILQNIPYRLITRETTPSVSRDIGLAYRDTHSLSRAARQFIDDQFSSRLPDE